MSPCKPLSINLNVESESKDDLKNRTRSQAKKSAAESNGSKISEAARTRSSSCPSDPACDEKRVVRPRKISKKTDPTASTEITSHPAQEVVDPPKHSETLNQRESINPSFTSLVQTVLLAIKENRAVELFFTDVENNPPRTFEPRQLIFDAFVKDWYVWGWDRRYNTERHHLLALIDHINIVNGVGRSTQGPYKDSAPANFIGGLLGGETIHVKLIIFKQWIFAVRQAPIPFPEFKLEEIEEGKAQITFTATDLRSIARWVMQFGDGVQVIEPQRLIDRIKQVGLAWSSKSVTTNIKATQIRHEQHPEQKSDYRLDTKHEITPDYKNLEQSKQNREVAEGTKTSKVEIRTGRL